MDRFDLGAMLAGGPAFLILGCDDVGETSAMTGYGWSGIYTSRVEAQIGELFASPSRGVQRFGAMRSVPSRSTRELQIRHLFGGLMLPEEELPGADAVTRAIRKSSAIQELSRLSAETITPRGVIVIEGWGKEDPLKPEDLMPILSQLSMGQVHLFSAYKHDRDEFVDDLIAREILVPHIESLESALSELGNKGAIPDRFGAEKSSHVIPIGDKFVPIDIATWNEVRRSARPIDLDLLKPPSLGSSASRYQEFRAFMGAPDGAPRWSGLSAGMNLKRDFEDQLEIKVNDFIQDPNAFGPIVVAGQTSTGKSIALAALAVKIAASGRAAVLHQSRRTSRPSFDDIEKFAQWSQDEGARAVVFIWDGMTDASEYESLARRLHARGRKVVLVGSTYWQKTSEPDAIKAPAVLSDGEVRRITRLLGNFGIEITPKLGPVDSSFLGFLYRALPETEHSLRHGLASEMRAAERGLRELTSQDNEVREASSRMTALEAAFAAAGYSLPVNEGSLVDESELYDASFDDRSGIQRVTTIVIVAGRYGLPVPMDLVLRTIGRQGSQSIRAALTAYDIIRDDEDETGELSLVARSRLEAILLAQHEVPLSVEAEVVETIIANVRTTVGYSSADEVSFLVQLLEVVGANASDMRFRPYYLDFSESLRLRRENDATISPRLVLQESALIRAHVHWQQTKTNTTTDERILLLERNRDTLEEVLADDTMRGMIRLSLAVELASTLGAITHEVTNSKDATADNLGLATRLDDIFNAVKSALAIDPTNVHPIDVLAWATRDALRSGVLSESERVDRAASALAMIESVDRDSVSAAKRAQLDDRSATLEGLLKNDEAVWHYLAELDVNEDPAATYFLAQFDARDGGDGEAKALTRLENSPATLRDWRCANLLLNLAWKRATGSDLLHGERVPLYMTEHEARYLRHVIASLDGVELPDTYRLNYVSAMLAFIGGDYPDARLEFRATQEATRQLTRRLHTTNLIANERGHARTYSGRVRWAQGRGGELWVNELGTAVRFDPLRFFASGEVAKNQSIAQFTVGFKLSTGAVAEPVGFKHGNRA
ncbi:P-loop NTPase [Brevibacterium zhoupengii]|uniref:P-loop NTPase n=1 Tax=Brevibacterium zhoupengii TaxID=2898795 RepID=UPI001E48ED3B|nr:hypothetical protein [Brevibacterium zhoupengii]